MPDSFVFRFAIPAPAPGPPGPAAVTEAVRLEIESLLEIVTFTSGGQPVQVDGFMFVADGSEITSLRPSAHFRALIEETKTCDEAG